jgi:hypothetical protein
LALQRITVGTSSIAVIFSLFNQERVVMTAIGAHMMIQIQRRKRFNHEQAFPS